MVATAVSLIFLASVAAAQHFISYRVAGKFGPQSESYTAAKLFAASAALSLLLLELLLSEVSGCFNPKALLVAWKVTIASIIFLSYVALPFAFFLESAACSLERGRKWDYICACLGTAAVVALYFLCGVHFGLPLTSVNEDHLLARVGVIGLLITSSLSGFGSVQYPFRCAAGFRSVDDGQIREAQAKARLVEAQKAEKAAQLDSLRKAQANAALDVELGLLAENSRAVIDSAGSRATLQAFWTETSSFFDASSARGGERNENLDKAVAAVEEELNDLDFLFASCQREVESVLQIKAAMESRRTLSGQMALSMEVAMTLVCAYRVVSALLSTLYGASTNEDPATRGLRLLFSSMKVSTDVAYVAPYASMLVMGIIITLTIRDVVFRLSSLFKKVKRSALTGPVTVLGAHLVASYAAANIFLLRVYLPKTFRPRVSRILGSSLQIDAFQTESEAVFFVSSCVSAVILLWYYIIQPGKRKLA